MFRIVAAPVLLVLILTDRVNWFRWLLAISFYTDLIDGYLARRFKVTSILGAKLDSIGDDLTVAMGIVGLFVLHTDFMRAHILTVILLFILLVVLIVSSLLRYGKLTNFHTYSAKLAAFAQGVFILAAFFFREGPDPVLFYIGAALTAIDILEETALVFLIPDWQANVKGLLWLRRYKKKQ